MSLYFFRISHGRYSGASEQGSEFESREAAWAEMTKVCGNLLGGISRSLKQNAEWHMELLDESKKPVFRIRVVAESLGLGGRIFAETCSSFDNARCNPKPDSVSRFASVEACN